MPRHVTVAAVALALVMIAPGARAAVISGTWSFAVDAWAVPSPLIPTPPVTGSATFAFDNSGPADGVLGDFTTSFPSALGVYHYDDSLDSLLIDFDGAGFNIAARYIDVSTHIIEPSVSPILHSVVASPSLTIQIAASSFSGGFATTPLPGTLPLFAVSLGALGLVGWRHRAGAA